MSDYSSVLNKDPWFNYLDTDPLRGYYSRESAISRAPESVAGSRGKANSQELRFSEVLKIVGSYDRSFLSMCFVAYTNNETFAESKYFEYADFGQKDWVSATVRNTKPDGHPVIYTPRGGALLNKGKGVDCILTSKEINDLASKTQCSKRKADLFIPAFDGNSHELANVCTLGWSLKQRMAHGAGSFTMAQNPFHMLHHLALCPWPSVRFYVVQAVLLVLHCAASTHNDDISQCIHSAIPVYSGQSRKPICFPLPTDKPTIEYDLRSKFAYVLVEGKSWFDSLPPSELLFFTYRSENKARVDANASIRTTLDCYRFFLCLSYGVDSVLSMETLVNLRPYELDGRRDVRNTISSFDSASREQFRSLWSSGAGGSKALFSPVADVIEAMDGFPTFVAVPTNGEERSWTVGVSNTMKYSMGKLTLNSAPAKIEMVPFSNRIRLDCGRDNFETACVKLCDTLPQTATFLAKLRGAMHSPNDLAFYNKRGQLSGYLRTDPHYSLNNHVRPDHTLAEDERFPHAAEDVTASFNAMVGKVWQATYAEFTSLSDILPRALTRLFKDKSRGNEAVQYVMGSNSKFLVAHHRRPSDIIAREGSAPVKVSDKSKISMIAQLGPHALSFDRLMKRGSVMHPFIASLRSTVGKIYRITYGIDGPALLLGVPEYDATVKLFKSGFEGLNRDFAAGTFTTSSNLAADSDISVHLTSMLVSASGLVFQDIASIFSDYTSQDIMSGHVVQLRLKAAAYQEATQLIGIPTENEVYRGQLLDKDYTQYPLASLLATHAEHISHSVFECPIASYSFTPSDWHNYGIDWREVARVALDTTVESRAERVPEGEILMRALIKVGFNPSGQFNTGNWNSLTSASMLDVSEIIGSQICGDDTASFAEMRTIPDLLNLLSARATGQGQLMKQSGVTVGLGGTYLQRTSIGLTTILRRRGIDSERVDKLDPKSQVSTLYGCAMTAGSTGGFLAMLRVMGAERTIKGAGFRFEYDEGWLTLGGDLPKIVGPLDHVASRLAMFEHPDLFPEAHRVMQIPTPMTTQSRHVASAFAGQHYPDEATPSLLKGDSVVTTDSFGIKSEAPDWAKNVVNNVNLMHDKRKLDRCINFMRSHFSQINRMRNVDQYSYINMPVERLTTALSTKLSTGVRDTRAEGASIGVESRQLSRPSYSGYTARSWEVGRVYFTVNNAYIDVKFLSNEGNNYDHSWKSYRAFYASCGIFEHMCAAFFGISSSTQHTDPIFPTPVQCTAERLIELAAIFRRADLSLSDLGDFVGLSDREVAQLERLNKFGFDRVKGLADIASDGSFAPTGILQNIDAKEVLSALRICPPATEDFPQAQSLMIRNIVNYNITIWSRMLAQQFQMQLPHTYVFPLYAIEFNRE